MAESVKKSRVEAVACADGVYGNDLYWFDHCQLKSLLDDRAATSTLRDDDGKLLRQG